MTDYRIFDIVSKEELQPEADKHDGLINDLDDIVDKADHRPNFDVVWEKKSAHDVAKEDL